MLKVENLTISFNHKTVLKNINLTISPNKRTSIIGPNGCGKSTLLKAVSGLNSKFQGKIYLGERELYKIPRSELAREMAILPQGATAPADLRVKDLVAYGRFPYKSTFARRFDNSSSKEDKIIIEEAMEKTQITHLSNQLVSTLSGGERQRAWIAMALAQQPKILLLDEPTTYLDIAHQLEVMQIVTELNKHEDMTIIMVLHDMNHALLYSDEIIIIKNQEIYCQGTPKETLTKDTLREVFGVQAELYRSVEHPEEEIIFPMGLTPRR